jgi:hypothetical protein
MLKVIMDTINYAGSISLFQLRGVILNTLTFSNQVITFRPTVEIISPFLNPTVLSVI